MATGPRKFSEKIALLNQKEAEGNAAFDSIMNEVGRIRPGSGSQVDLIENIAETKHKSIHSAIDEAIAFNEHVSITYEHQQYQQFQQQQQLNLPTKKQKHQKTKHQQHQDHNMSLIKNELTQYNLTQAPNLLPTNPFLQLPNQGDSFRRAHSDSSIHNTVVNQNQNQMTNTYQNNSHQQQQQQQQQNFPQQQQQHHPTQHLQQYQIQTHNLQQATAPHSHPIQHINFQQQTFQQQQYQQTNSPVYNNNNNSNQPIQSNFAQNNLNSNSNANAIPFRNLTLSINSLASPDQKNSNNNSNVNSPTSTKALSPTSPNTNHSILGQHNSNGVVDIASSPVNSPINNHHQNNYLIHNFGSKQQDLSNIAANSNEVNLNNNGTSNNNPNSPQGNFMPMYNLQHLNVHPQHHHHHHHHQQQNHQHQQQQYQSEHSNSNSTALSPSNSASKNINNNNLLNPGQISTGGGSLPDLTSFQSQLNPYQQSDEYNKRIQNQNQNVAYDNSSQLLQPNFQQHNYIGPVKPTHANSVSPTRGMARYSPTSSSSNLNALTNRRPSPQRPHHNPLPLSDLGNSHQTIQSMPSSPHQIPSINSPLPSLEFTINSQQVNNYLNGLQNGALNLNNASGNSPTNHTNILNNIIQYRNGSLNQGINGESLPPSPQSQQSCFNSPQGSPGPLSISPQDLNPFTTQNYDIMQKKFDSINLEASQSIQSNYNNVPHQQHHQHYNTNFVLASPPHQNSLNNNKNNNHTRLGSISSPENNINSGSNDGGNINENLNSDNIDSEIGPYVLNSRSNSISSNSSSSGNQNNDFNEIELQNLNSSFKNNEQNNINNNNSNRIKNNRNDNNTNNHNNNNSNILNHKAHKNSIPNIILTFSGDSVEEKNELIIKDLSNDMMYNDDLLIKNEQFDLDLQMLSDSPVSLDQSLSNVISFHDDQTLYQNS